MSKAALVVALGAIVVAGACLAVAAQPRSQGVFTTPESHFAVRNGVTIALARPEPSPIALNFRSPILVNARDANPLVDFTTFHFPVVAQTVLWRPIPDGRSEFGTIPTEWTTRPQLLPGTWDVETVFAAGTAGVASRSAGTWKRQPR